jgi:diguanylate cyclase (GGDEF)-like protein
MSEYSKNVTILYIEDEDDLREGYSRALERISKKLYTAKNGEIGLDKYEEFRPDIIISDIKMPVMDGIDMAKEIDKINPDANIIFTTAHSESAYLLEAVKLRVEGYLLKPVSKTTLMYLIEKIAKKIKLESENTELRAELTYMAYQDSLTSLYNRNKFEELFRYEQERFKRHHNPVSLAILDIDHFKQFNDRYGHIVGDEVLILLAKLLTSKTRKIDTVARWGGEEFVLLFNNTDLSTALEKSEKIREAIRALQHPIAGNISASFGVSTLKENDTLQTLFNRADIALYKAKDNGRNLVISQE